MAELYQVYVNGKKSGKVFDISNTCQGLGGDAFSNYDYLSSSQYDGEASKAWGLTFSSGTKGGFAKDYTGIHTRCIREF